MATEVENISLEDLLYAFDAGTKGRTMPQPPPSTVLRVDGTHGKHLALLDGMALLLVTPASRPKDAAERAVAAADNSNAIVDVAAVSLDVRAALPNVNRTTTLISYTKHTPSSDKETAFIDAVVRIVQSANDARAYNEQYPALLQLVMQHCFPKISSRFRKVAERWQLCNPTEPQADSVAMLQQTLLFYPVKPRHRMDAPWSTWIRSFLASSFSTPCPTDVRELASVIGVCHRLSSLKDVAEAVGSTELEEAIEKLAMFDRVVVEMVGQASEQPLTTIKVRQVSVYLALLSRYSRYSRFFLQAFLFLNMRVLV